ncbi:MAG: hypothetical protein IKU37_01470 [Candidatus Gastranaerophilales bacterium]|nr:hypothetical protein [Candidatus Gastranaerophilales bacterium]
MKIILNKCFGGFGLSKNAHELYAEKKGMKVYEYYQDYRKGLDCFKKGDSGVCKFYFTKDFGEEIELNDEEYDKYCLNLTSENRTDKTLIEVVEELGQKANSGFSELEVVEIPDNSFYKIDEYDGVETIYYSDAEIKEK